MAYLVLSNGMAFEGQRIGADAESSGELVFTTGVVGYIETLSDPNYAGQIVVQTFPLIGNYGAIAADLESTSLPAGYVVRECCGNPSNFRSEGTLEAFLKEKGVPGISGVDTRRITRVIREAGGTVYARICDEVPADPAAICGSAVNICRRERAVFPAGSKKKYSVALIDYGAKMSLISALTRRGCEVTALPCDASAADVLSLRPDGIVLSGGPGDPAAYAFAQKQLMDIIGMVPVFGVGLGHQLAAMAMGGKVLRLPCGHRGSNQPVKDTNGTRTYITSQNHGYAVDGASLREGRVSFINANDGSCEGVDYPGRRCFTVQFSPDDSGGAHSTSFIYDRFTSMMGGRENA